MNFKKLMIFFLIFSSTIAFTQKKINIPVSGEGKSNSGTYRYKANVEFQVIPEGLLVDVVVSRKVSNYQITSYNYKDISATEVGYNFPIYVNRFTNKAFVDIQFYKGTVSYTARNLEPNGSTYLSDSQLKNLFNTFNIDPKKRDCITCDAIKEVKNLNIKAYNVKLEDLGYQDVFSEINTKIDKLINDKEKKEQNIQKINDLRNQINSLGISKEDLQEKKSLYQKLDRIDTENDYSDEINNIEEEIKDLKEKEKKEKEEKLKEEENSENDSNTDDTNSETEDEENDEEAEKRRLEEEQEAERKKQEDAEAERQRQIERQRAEKERIRKKVENYQNKKAEANKENRRIASASAASTASVFYLLGGIIYSNMGSNNGQIFAEDSHNLHIGLDIGYSTTSTPIYFGSNYENINQSTGDIYYVEKNTPSQPITLNLGLKAQLAMEGDYYRGEGYLGIRGGLSPIFDAFHSNFFYGFQASGGLPFVKALAGIEWSKRTFSKSDILDSQEFGEGKSSFGTTALMLGLKLSWYGRRNFARNHVSFGIIKEQVTSLGDDVLLENINSSRSPGSTLVGDLEIYNAESDFSTYTGYFAEWKHDHYGVLSIVFFPQYPHTGEIPVNQYDSSDWSSHGSFSFNIGYTRSFDWFKKID